MSLIRRAQNALIQTGFQIRNELTGRYSLRRYLPKPQSGAGVDAERQFYKLLLAHVVDRASAELVESVWDVGCRNWSYAHALAESFPEAAFIGVEVDGGRRYLNLHRRMDQARANAAELVLNGRLARCEFKDFRNIDVAEEARPNAHLAFCFFFPFVSPNPCLKWGLPLEFANFESLLKHAREQTQKAGAKSLILSSHQGEWEAEIAREVYERLGLKIKEVRVSPREFEGLWPSSHDVHVLSTRP